MYKALYRKYRPATFDDMVGQEHIRTVLKRQCQTGRTSHAYIFCGTRGTGKTTSAKILAKAVNCLSPIDGDPCCKCSACLSIDAGTATDILELDAASNNSVDDIRRLCDELIYPPTVLKRRVYIIDEVHMLSSSAYNALLKTLEEPPEHVLFILATTELNKIPPTVLSRCQRFEFRRIPAAAIAGRLLEAAASEGLDLTDEGASLIARLADGSMRDGFSLLESCIEAANGGQIDRAVVSMQLGIAEDNTISQFFEAVSHRDIPACLTLIDEYYNSAKSLSVLLDDMLSAVRDMLYVKQGGSLTSYMANIGEKEASRLSSLFTGEQLVYFAETAEEARNRLTGYAMNKRLVTELALLRMCDARFSLSPEALAARISLIEGKLALGSVVVNTPIPMPEAVEVTEPPVHTEVKSSAEPTTASPAEYEKRSELLENLRERPDVAKLLGKCDITSDGQTLFVAVGDAFTRSILESSAEIIGNAARIADGTCRRIVISEKLSSGKSVEHETFIDEI